MTKYKKGKDKSEIDVYFNIFNVLINAGADASIADKYDTVNDKSNGNKPLEYVKPGPELIGHLRK